MVAYEHEWQHIKKTIDYQPPEKLNNDNDSIFDNSSISSTNQSFAEEFV